jgi:hypothetical protein
MSDHEPIAIRRSSIFNLEQARAVLPVIRRITQEFSSRVEALMARLETVSLTQTETINRLEGEVNELVKTWHEKLRKLGTKPKGLWLVDFDCGDGYFCWKYPETELGYWHAYSDGFTGRVPVGARGPSPSPSHSQSEL